MGQLASSAHRPRARQDGTIIDTWHGFRIPARREPYQPSSRNTISRRSAECICMRIAIDVTQHLVTDSFFFVLSAMTSQVRFRPCLRVHGSDFFPLLAPRCDTRPRRECSVELAMLAMFGGRECTEWY